MAKTPKPETEPFVHENADGPIPLDNFGNDLPGNPVDKSPGSLYDHLNQTHPKAPADKK